MNPNRRIKTAVLGATGLVGQEFVRLLADHPWFELALLTASARSTGLRYAEAAAWAVPGEMPRLARAMEIVPCSARLLSESGVRIAFSALPAAAARGVEAGLRAGGLAVFSNAGAHRMDEDVPVLIPEANADHLGLVRRQIASHGGFIVANSNCTASGLALALKPLEPFGIRTVVVASYQAISGAGRRGLSAFDIAANVVPFIADEEEKVERESRKVLGRLDGAGIEPAPFAVHAGCARVPVRFGHLLSATVELGREPAPAEAEEAFVSFRSAPQDLGLPTAPERPVIVRPEEDRPQPLRDVHAGSPERAQGMAVTVGRLRRQGRFLSFFLLVHNTVRGAAGTSVLNAELALRRGLIAP